MGEKRPEISVIMSIYNPKSKEQTINAVRSILDQSFKDFEFIIFDDGSDSYVADDAGEIAAMDERIRIMRRDENKGLAFSLNQCIKEAKGRYIARMDADDVSLPERLKTQIDFLETNKQYQWCGCNIILFDKDGEYGKFDYPAKPQTKDYLKFSPFAHPSVVFRAELFTDEIKYNVSEETLRCEDYELFMRLHQMGLKGYNIQKYLFCYYKDRKEQKQTMKLRMNEAKIRYRNFKKMNVPAIKAAVYVLRPVAGGLIPSSLLAAFKRRTYKNES